MVKVGSKLLVAAIILVIAAACSSESAEPDVNQNNSPAGLAGQQTQEIITGDSNTSPDSSDRTQPENISPAQQPDDSPQSLPGGENETVEPEPTATSAPPKPTPEPDVIPLATAQEESSIIEMQPDQEYPQGTMVGSSDIGLAFKIPQDWTGVLPQGSPAFLLASETKPGLVILTSQQSNSIDEILDTLSKPMPLDQGVVLQPNGQPTVNGPWVEVQASATDGIDEVDGYVMALVRENGVGMFIAAIGPEAVEYYQGLGLEIAQSTRATSTTVASDQSASASVSGSDSTALAKEWTDFFSGMRATYLSSYSSGSSGGFSDKSEFDFCSDGQFAQSGSSSLSVDTMGASAFSGGSSGGTGTWKIVTQGDRVILELNWSDGSVGQSLLEYVDSKTYINGERYFITPDNTTCP